jgi:DnaJ-class molecular chaperone
MASSSSTKNGNINLNNDSDEFIDYFSALGIDRTYNVYRTFCQSKDEETVCSLLKKAYHEKAKELHPDRHANLTPSESKDMEIRFKMASEAYERLLNPEFRQRHAIEREAVRRGRQTAGESTSSYTHTSVPADSDLTLDWPSRIYVIALNSWKRSGDSAPSASYIATNTASLLLNALKSYVFGNRSESASFAVVSEDKPFSPNSKPNNTDEEGGCVIRKDFRVNLTDIAHGAKRTVLLDREERVSVVIFVSPGTVDGTRYLVTSTPPTDEKEAETQSCGQRYMLSLVTNAHEYFRRGERLKGEDPWDLFTTCDISLQTCLSGNAHGTVVDLDGKIHTWQYEPGKVVTPGDIVCIKKAGLPGRGIGAPKRGNIWATVRVSFGFPQKPLNEDELRAFFHPLKKKKRKVKKTHPPPNTFSS